MPRVSPGTLRNRGLARENHSAPVHRRYLSRSPPSLRTLYMVVRLLEATYSTVPPSRSPKSTIDNDEYTPRSSLLRIRNHAKRARRLGQFHHGNPRLLSRRTFSFRDLGDLIGRPHDARSGAKANPKGEDIIRGCPIHCACHDHDVVVDA